MAKTPRTTTTPIKEGKGNGTGGTGGGKTPKAAPPAGGKKGGGGKTGR